MKTVLVTPISYPNLYHHNGIVRKYIQENEQVFWFTHKNLVDQMKYIFWDCFNGTLSVTVIDDDNLQHHLQIATQIFMENFCDQLHVYGYGRPDPLDHQHYFRGPQQDKLRQVWVFERVVMPLDREPHCIVDGCDPVTEYRKIPFDLNLTGRYEDWLYVIDKTQKVFTKDGSMLHHLSRPFGFAEKIQLI